MFRGKGTGARDSPLAAEFPAPLLVSSFGFWAAA